MTHLLHRLSPWLLAATLLSGCGSAVINPVSGQAERSVMSEQDEVAQGAQAHQQVLQEYGVVRDARVQTYVNNLGQRLAKLSHRNQLQWHFTVLDSPEINAFALPGGYVYVTRGIMAYLQTEAELAGVMGHEIGHVTARHGAQRATRQQDAGLGVLAASVLGAVLESQGISGAGRLASDLSQTAAAGYVASYGRDQELQADSLGAEYLARTAFDPRNMINVIGALKAQERFAADQARAAGRAAPSGNSWLASHPSNDQRLQQITQLAAQYKGNYSDEGRTRYQHITQGLAFGESADQGLTRGQNFYHTDLGIALTAPAGWQIQNEPSQLALVNATGDAALMVQVAPPKAGTSHDEVIRNLLKPSQGRTERLSINGLPATRFVGSRTSSQGQQAIEATLVTGPRQSVYVFTPAAKNAAALQQARPSLVQAQNSFRALTAQDRAAAKPWVIQTTSYPAGGFAQLAKRSPLPQAEAQLRLINGFYGGGEPRPGQAVKVVE
ncbi:M48 family metalloprotease [Rhodoferax sp.]|uniref:M48 family metalloprotease n=1 Tax=Rhodoferax sp. TaxID=50421 RepID=UPI0026051582|nr:M48 family metalloprotease [Rhodoferax sp.]MDD4944343.1 M48 family metalloprotease [Rhodoferax sp.]MDD5479255.1 M48 family metalloprotease [Rhodoferax sp.]